MIKYKLLKDINGSEAGYTFNYEAISWNYWKWEAILLNVQHLAYIIWIDNKEWFEEIKETMSIYDLEEDDEIYTIELWTIYHASYYFENQQKLLSAGDIFLTKEEAETELSKRKAMQIIKKWSWENDWGYEFNKSSSNVENYFIEYDIIDDKLLMGYVRNRMIWNIQYYSSSDIAEKALIELEDEYKILFDNK